MHARACVPSRVHACVQVRSCMHVRACVPSRVRAWESACVGECVRAQEWRKGARATGRDGTVEWSLSTTREVVTQQAHAAGASASTTATFVRCRCIACSGQRTTCKTTRSMQYAACAYAAHHVTRDMENTTRTMRDAPHSMKHANTDTHTRAHTHAHVRTRTARRGRYSMSTPSDGPLRIVVRNRCLRCGQLRQEAPAPTALQPAT